MPDPSGIKQLKRLGFRQARRILLPEYMYDDYFQEYGDIIDGVYQTLVDDKIAILKDIRSGWHENPSLETLVLDGQIVDNSTWDIFERDLVTRQINSLGLYLSSASSLSEDVLQNIVRFLGTYWWGRGTYAFIEFVNFCLGTNITMEKLWAEIDPANPEAPDYINFTPENADGTAPGLEVWNGGTWFPTTHVNLSQTGSSQNQFPLNDLVTLFYEIANYNLVINAMNYNFDVIVGSEGNPNNIQAVCIGFYTQFGVDVLVTDTP